MERHHGHPTMDDIRRNVQRQNSRDLLGKGRKKWWVRRSSSSASVGSVGAKHKKSTEGSGDEEVAPQLISDERLAAEQTLKAQSSAYALIDGGYPATASDLVAPVVVGNSAYAAASADGNGAGDAKGHSRPGSKDSRDSPRAGSKDSKGSRQARKKPATPQSTPRDQSSMKPTKGEQKENIVRRQTQPPTAEAEPKNGMLTRIHSL